MVFNFAFGLQSRSDIESVKKFNDYLMGIKTHYSSTINQVSIFCCQGIETAAVKSIVDSYEQKMHVRITVIEGGIATYSLLKHKITIL